jgi:hypothetical protein
MVRNDRKIVYFGKNLGMISKQIAQTNVLRDSFAGLGGLL